MKKLLALFSLLAAPLAAQSILTFGLGRFPGSDVTLENDTTDAVLQLMVNGKMIRGYMPYASTPWHGFFGPGFGDLAMKVWACSSITSTTVYAAGIPDWATDPTIVGGLAITEGFLDSQPSEPVLHRRIEDLKRTLDQQKRLGRKDMKKDLDFWYKGVKRVGLVHEEPVCVNAKTIEIRTRIAYDTFDRLAVPIRITGDRERGYRVEGPVDHWY
ncbi:MAG: hypothetical protein KGJ13_01045 [Patescibacteria group bacterium]|nr:hypothetical protein [Patescibacteria group bacterium]